MPDEGTLGLCSLIVSLCFAITFAIVARHHRARSCWRLWAFSNLSFSLGVIGFELSPHPVAALPAFIFYTLLAAGPLAISAGLDAFAQRQSPRWGMALALLPGLAFVVAPADVFGTTTLPQFAGGVGLAVTLAAAGLHLLQTSASQRVTARRLLGLAMLANLPSYISALVLPLQPTGMFHAVAHYAWMSQPILTLVINLALLAVPGLQAINELRCAALTDPLTKLHNRAWLAVVEPSYASRGGMIAAFDLDGFKQINDKNGHAAGDELLVWFASSLRSWCSRHGAEAVRLGGDEFLILMPGPSEHLAGDLRRHVNQAQPDLVGLTQCSTSIGFAECPPHATSLAGAMQAADMALYRDKAAKHRKKVAKRDPGLAKAA